MTVVELQEMFPFELVSTGHTQSKMPYHAIVMLSSYDSRTHKRFRKSLNEKYGIDIQCHISYSGLATLNFRNDNDFTEFVFVI